MESILVLAHTEEDGILARPALEALAAAQSLGGELTVGLVGARCSRRPTASADGRAHPGRPGRRLRAATLCHRSGGGGSAGQGLWRRAHSGAVPLPAGRARCRRGLPAGRAHRYPRHRDRRAKRRAGGDPLVLPPAHGGRADATQRPWIVLLDAGCVPGGSARPSPPTSSLWSRPPATRTDVTGIELLRRRADHPAGRQVAVRSRRRLDQEAGRRRGARGPKPRS